MCLPVFEVSCGLLLISEKAKNDGMDIDQINRHPFPFAVLFGQQAFYQLRQCIFYKNHQHNWSSSILTKYAKVKDKLIFWPVWCVYGWSERTIFTCPFWSTVACAQKLFLGLINQANHVNGILLEKRLMQELPSFELRAENSWV